jgi:hypothetical protein
MAKLKLKKLPRKPKAGASVATMETWLKKAADIKFHNACVKKQNDHAATLRKKIAAIGSADVLPSARSTFSAKRKKKAASKPKRKSNKRR